jgi:hypothetical protein
LIRFSSDLSDRLTTHDTRKKNRNPLTALFGKLRVDCKVSAKFAKEELRTYKE